jgi:hypothetical protein
MIAAVAVMLMVLATIGAALIAVGLGVLLEHLVSRPWRRPR